ncbi:tRNA (adenine(22)-N(1))-methyltransferase [Halalkalibacterium ligniniphilum]|uniref:tRNA (adenine(22)-N(1))-methyltransferase n=1 Tax=Halalkalibacterium ligniniphilum TaxID=1134413 RepID=UPI0003466312|nr:tRNA (adenine(22)-N(1))-methyltransferase TrmK [Halalkalibacterium ligniniphilum]
MNEVQLSARLRKVASYVPKGSRVADIGSDHAYLPCYLCLQGIASAAIAGEVNEGPFQSARQQVAKVGLEKSIAVRKGNGLAVLEPGEVDVITIAGMGGTLITTILAEGKDKLEGVSRLILQPNVHAKAIREWLLESGWKLVAEDILEEDEKIYEVLVAEKITDSTTSIANKEKLLLLGPFLIKEKNQAFQKKWMMEKENWKKVLAQLDKAQSTPELEEKRDELKRKIQYVEEALKNE